VVLVIAPLGRDPTYVRPLILKRVIERYSLESHPGLCVRSPTVVTRRRTSANQKEQNNTPREQASEGSKKRPEERSQQKTGCFTSPKQHVRVVAYHQRTRSLFLLEPLLLSHPPQTSIGLYPVPAKQRPQVREKPAIDGLRVVRLATMEQRRESFVLADISNGIASFSLVRSVVSKQPADLQARLA